MSEAIAHHRSIYKPPQNCPLQKCSGLPCRSSYGPGSLICYSKIRYSVFRCLNAFRPILLSSPQRGAAMPKWPLLHPIWKRRPSVGTLELENLCSLAPGQLQNPKWGYLGLGQQNNTPKSEQPHLKKSGLGRGIEYGTLPLFLPPRRTDPPHSRPPPPHDTCLSSAFPLFTGPVETFTGPVETLTSQPCTGLCTSTPSPRSAALWHFCDSTSPILPAEASIGLHR